MKIYRLLYSIYMMLTGSLNHLHVIFRVHVIYRFRSPFTCFLQEPFRRFTCYLHGLCPLVSEIYRIVFIIYMFHLKHLHVFLQYFSKKNSQYKCKRGKSMEIIIYSIFDDLHVIYVFFYMVCKFSTFPETTAQAAVSGFHYGKKTTFCLPSFCKEGCTLCCIIGLCRRYFPYF